MLQPLASPATGGAAASSACPSSCRRRHVAPACCVGWRRPGLSGCSPGSRLVLHLLHTRSAHTKGRPRAGAHPAAGSHPPAACLTPPPAALRAPATPPAAPPTAPARARRGPGWGAALAGEHPRRAAPHNKPLMGGVPAQLSCHRPRTAPALARATAARGPPPTSASSSCTVRCVSRWPTTGCRWDGRQPAARLACVDASAPSTWSLARGWGGRGAGAWAG
jgi:hypothetical protein